MENELAEAIASLTQIVDEENDRLMTPGYHADLAALIAAKGRLAGMVEASMARLSRESPDWMRTLSEEMRGALQSSFEGVMRRLEVNGKLLERRIELCDELMGAISAEAQRLTGARSVVYGAQGALTRSEQTAPISLNSRI